MSCSIYILGEEEGRGECLGYWQLSSQVTIAPYGAQHFLTFTLPITSPIPLRTGGQGKRERLSGV